MVTASITYGYGLCCAQLLQLLYYIWLQPVLHMVTASITYGYGLCGAQLLQLLYYIWLQPVLHMVTASITYGYGLCGAQLLQLLAPCRRLPRFLFAPAAQRRLLHLPRRLRAFEARVGLGLGLGGEGDRVIG